MSILSSGICTDNGRINVIILPNDICIFLVIHWIERRRRERIPHYQEQSPPQAKQTTMRQASLEPSHGTVTEHALDSFKKLHHVRPQEGEGEIRSDSSLQIFLLLFKKEAEKMLV